MVRPHLCSLLPRRFDGHLTSPPPISIRSCACGKRLGNGFISRLVIAFFSTHNPPTRHASTVAERQFPTTLLLLLLLSLAPLAHTDGCTLEAHPPSSVLLRTFCLFLSRLRASKYWVCNPRKCRPVYACRQKKPTTPPPPPQENRYK